MKVSFLEEPASHRKYIIGIAFELMTSSQVLKCKLTTFPRGPFFLYTFKIQFALCKSGHLFLYPPLPLCASIYLLQSNDTCCNLHLTSMLNSSKYDWTQNIKKIFLTKKFMGGEKQALERNLIWHQIYMLLSSHRNPWKRWWWGMVLKYLSTMWWRPKNDLVLQLAMG